MERSLLESLDLQSNSPRRLESLSTARSLLTNPNSSDSTRQSISNALLRSLDHHAGDPAHLRHVIKLLSDAAACHRPLKLSILPAIRPLFSTGEIPAAVVALADFDGEGVLVLDEDRVLSLATSSVVSIRSRIPDLLISRLKKDRDCALLPLNLVVRVLLALAVDLYPSVQRAAVDGLAALCKECGSGFEMSTVECCYNCAVELLRDDEEFVRLAVVRLISECGLLFAEEGTDNMERMDLIFVQLCLLARDMRMKVRVESFIALGRVRLVSESLLIKSLSKKFSWIKSGKKTLAECSTRGFKFSSSCAAGAFVHGIEDEFYEVRAAACNSLGILAVFSIKFADDALNLLMDMVNDDAAAVRLQTLQTLFHMAATDRLRVQERHMHMFLGLLTDTSASIRTATRKVLGLMRIPELEIFKSTIDGLTENMETYPEEEEDIFFVLFLIGKNHGHFATTFAKEFADEMLSRDGELSLNGPRVAALLVLAISSPFSGKHHRLCDTPSSVFSYAIPLFGRISSSLRRVIDQDSLLAYLFHRSDMPFSATTLKSKGVGLLPNIDERISNYTKQAGEKYCYSEIRFLEQSQTEIEVFDEEVVHSIKLIMETVTETWKLIQSCCTFEALNTLRSCREELEMIAWNATLSLSAVVAFALQYIEVIRLVAETWEQLKPRPFHMVGMVSLDLLLEKLDSSLRRIRYRFPGICREVECHILELMLLAHVLRLYRVGVCSYQTLKKLRVTVSRLERLCGERSASLSGFAEELKRISSEERLLFPARHLLDLFYLEPMPLIVEGLRHIKAELEAPGNDSENPMPFLSGLPVGITFRIKLYHVSEDERLWLRMAVDGMVQFAYLDLQQFECSEGVRECVVCLPFYAAPRATSCLLRSCVCMECPLEDVNKGNGGPKHEVALLCEDIDVYMTTIENR